MKKYFLIPALVLLAGGGVASAEIILSDTFTYINGDISTAPGSPWVVHSGTTEASITGNELRLTGGNSADVNALLANGPYLSNSASVLFSSFKVRWTSLPGGPGTYFAHFKDTNTGAATGFGARVWVATTNAESGGFLSNNLFRVGIGNGTLTSAASGQVFQNLSLNTTYTVVTRFVPMTGTATIWLNPNAESDPSVTATDEGTSGRPNPIDVVAYAFRQSGGIGALLVDDLRVGTTFADVAGPNSPPSITGIPHQNIPANSSTAALPFTIGDAESAASTLNLAATSSNPSLVPVANIVFGGTGSNRNVTVTPAAGQQGSATVTLSVTDGGGATASTSFQVAVGVPTISNIPNQSTPTNTVLGPVSFTIGDAETPLGSLVVTATSANQALVPDASISLGGSGASRTLTITPAADQAGLVTITVTVNDGIVSASDTFVLTVYPLLGQLRSDNFDRPDGPLFVFDGQWLSNGGTGATNAQQVNIAGQRVELSEHESEDVSTELPPGQFTPPVYTTASGVILYVGLTINYAERPTPAGSYFCHFRDSGNGFRARVFASREGAPTGHFRLGIANNAAAINPAGQLPTDLETNRNYQIVIRYNVGTGESRLWLDPADESSPSLAAVDTPQPVDIEAFSFRQNDGIGIVRVDDLKIGTTFTDVAALRYRLAIQASGDDVTLSWPVAATGYNLQFTDEIYPVNWMDYTGQVDVQGDQNVVSYLNTTGHRYFRLSKP